VLVAMGNTRFPLLRGEGRVPHDVVSDDRASKC
jgi:hypothetical protein